LGKVLGVRYIITGSITKFGGEQKDKGGSLKGIHVGLGKNKTEVTLTARLVDATTGEVVMAAKGEGVSKKGGGMSFGKSGLGGFGKNTSDFKESAIGEAQEAAARRSWPRSSPRRSASRTDLPRRVDARPGRPTG